VLSGQGEMWRSAGGQQQIVTLTPGTCLTIPAGVDFQFRSQPAEALAAVAITMPPWPGDGEAEFVDGRWQSTVAP
jgi:mannose-6-phosphate isomerase-like protein (cupin superfamily)